MHFCDARPPPRPHCAAVRVTYTAPRFSTAMCYPVKSNEPAAAESRVPPRARSPPSRNNDVSAVNSRSLVRGMRNCESR